MSAAQILILILALLAANLPFVTRRIFFFGPASSTDSGKSFAWRLTELIVLYLLVGAVAALFESHDYGELYPRGWQFYAITICLFIVFAYPGFVVRYLWQRRKG
jgi:Protein of unknown function (DUF2818)